MASSPAADDNRSVYVSVETLSVILGVVGILISLAAGFGWFIRRTDARFDQLLARIDSGDAKLEQRIDAVDTKLSQRIDSVETKLGERIDVVAHELVEVKIAIARLEGPPPRLVPVR
jgi:hypothetical protein